MTTDVFVGSNVATDHLTDLTGVKQGSKSVGIYSCIVGDSGEVLHFRSFGQSLNQCIGRAA